MVQVAGWEATAAIHSDNPASPMDNNSVSIEGPQAQASYSNDSIELVFPPNGTDLSLSHQCKCIACLLCATIKNVQLDSVFEDAFPEQPLQHVIVPNAFITVAHDLNDLDLMAHIQSNVEYCHALVRIICHFVSHTSAISDVLYYL